VRTLIAYSSPTNSLLLPPPPLQGTPGTLALESLKDFEVGEPVPPLDYDGNDLYYAAILPPGPSCLDSPLPTLDESPEPACKTMKDEPIVVVSVRGVG